MSKNKRHEKEQTPCLKKVFGRVISHPDCHKGSPFLNGTDITIDQVLTLINQELSDEEIIEQIPELEQEHIDICRAYQARFLSHTRPEFKHVDPDDKIIMLDENVSYLMLHDVARIFGWTSHVFADGLYNENNDDEGNIWAHMIDNGYKAILTEDNDFKRISRNHRKKLLQEFNDVADCQKPTPVVIHISKNVGRTRLIEMLHKHADDIRKYIEENDGAFATLTRSGLRRYAKDVDTKAELSRQSHPSASPS